MWLKKPNTSKALEQLTPLVHEMKKACEFDSHDLQAINLYLAKSEHVELDQSAKLVALACLLEDKECRFPWSFIDLIYAHTFEENAPDKWSYGLWSAAAARYFRSQTATENDKIAAAQRADSLINEMQDIFPQDALYGRAEWHFYNPLRKTNDVQGLVTARAALERLRADEPDEFEDNLEAKLLLAHCLFDLKEFDEACELYQSINADESSRTFPWATDLARRIASCQNRSSD